MKQLKLLFFYIKLEIGNLSLQSRINMSDIFHLISFFVNFANAGVHNILYILRV